MKITALILTLALAGCSGRTLDGSMPQYAPGEHPHDDFPVHFRDMAARTAAGSVSPGWTEAEAAEAHGDSNESRSEGHGRQGRD